MDGLLVQQGDILLPAPYIVDGIGSIHAGTKDYFLWSMIRAAPGNSRTRGIAFYKQTDGSTTDANTIYACIEKNSTWASCSNPVSNNIKQVYSLSPVPPGEALLNAAADMAITTNGVHAIGWHARNGSTRSHRIAFSADDGQSWGAAITLGTYTDSSLTVWDMDLAVNDNQEIGALLYLKGAADELLLYVWDTTNFNPNTPQVVTIVPGTGTVRVATDCSSSCFTLTGDRDNTFHAFYQVASGGLSNLKVTSVNGGSQVTRDIVSNINMRFLTAARTRQGSGLLTWGPGIFLGFYDIPTQGTLPAPRSLTLNYLGAMADSAWSDKLYASDGDEIIDTNERWRAHVVPLSGTQPPPVFVNDTPITDPLSPESTINPCTNVLANTSGTRCYIFQDSFYIHDAGAVVAGNRYYTTSVLSVLQWTGTPFFQYIPIPDQSRIVIHQVNTFWP